MFFRDYREKDFDELETFWNSLGLGGQEREDSHEMVQSTIRHGGKLIILENEATGEIVGSSWMTCDGRRMYLHHFGIKKSYQKQGFGLQLASESLNFIKQQGFQVKLEVHKQNAAAKRLYEKAGFFAYTDYDIYMIRKVSEL